MARPLGPADQAVWMRDALHDVANRLCVPVETFFVLDADETQEFLRLWRAMSDTGREQLLARMQIAIEEGR